jgi:hypothetical protein
MKKIFAVFLWSTFSFVVLTLTTAKIETPFDGDDNYGFPFTFFVRFSGMCKPCPPNPTETKISYLLIDILFSIIVGLLLWFVARKIKLSLTKKKYGT